MLVSLLAQVTSPVEYVQGQLTALAHILSEGPDSRLKRGSMDDVRRAASDSITAVQRLINVRGL